MTTNTAYQPARAWSMTVLLALFMLINFIDKVGMGLVAVPMMAELKLSPTQFGVIAGSFYWVFAIAGVVGGFMANRMSAKWMLLVMVVFWSLAQLPIILSSSIAMIIVSRVLLGIGEGPASPVSFHACYKWFPDHKRNLPISVINLGSGIGLLVAGVSVPLVTAHWGWRANFVLMAIVGLVWGFIWLLFGAEGKVDGQHIEVVPGAPTSRSALPERIPYRRLLRDPTVVGVIILHFMAFWGLALSLTWLPAYLQKGLGYDAVTSGRLFALVVLINIPVSLGISAWSQRLMGRGVSARQGRAVVASLALLLGGALFMSLMWLPLQPLGKVVVLAIASGLTPAIYSLGAAMMGAVSPVAQRGSMLAIENSIASLAGVIAPIVMGGLIESASGPAALGYEQGFALSGVLLVAGGLIGLKWVNPERSAVRLSNAAGIT